MKSYLTYIALLSVVLFSAAGLVACSADSRADSNVDAPQQEAVDKQVTLYKNPSCGCCDKWAEYIEEAGYAVETDSSKSVVEVKQERGVPRPLASCHTALIGDYVVEGHVPLAAIEKLLKERPPVAGIAVPGMPMGSPGMGTDPDLELEVQQFDDDGSRELFGRFLVGSEDN